MIENVRSGVEALVGWARRDALPLWAEVGFDRESGSFHEQLGFDRAPILHLPRRAMVQARQISVYAHAALLGWYPAGGELALRAADNLIARYGRDGGRAGFSFALDPSGTRTGPAMDLYAQAFVLFGLAWAWRIEPRPLYRDTADRLLAYLDEAYGDPVRGGYWDADPRPDAFRRQNPHMHLFEALLEWHEAAGGERYLGRLGGLRRLFEDRFCDAPGGVVHELYDDRWQVQAPVVEPGHLMEWAWLLIRHDRVLGQGSAVPDRLIAHALAHGVDHATGRVLDEVTADGAVLKASSRSWPHTETIKALAASSEGGGATDLPALAAVLARLKRVYLPDALNGGWIDQVDAADRPTSTAVPASTFYHVFLAVAEAARVFAPRHRGSHAP